MVEDVLRRLDVTVHHRRGALQALPVRFAMHLEPGVGPALLRLDALADAVGEDLGAAARQRGLTGFTEPRDHVVDRQPRDLGHRADLRRREEMRRDVREAPPCLPHEREVVVEGDRRIVAALQQHRRRALRGGERHLREHLVHGERVGVPIPGLAIEGAELAVGHADVRVVRVRIDHERDRSVRQAAKARGLRERAHFEQGRVREQVEAVRAVEPLAGAELFADGVERRRHTTPARWRRSSAMPRSSSGPNRYVKPPR